MTIEYKSHHKDQNNKQGVGDVSVGVSDYSRSRRLRHKYDVSN